MKKYFSLVILLFISCMMSAQPGKKPAAKKRPAQTTQPDINKMMEEAMKQENMTEEEKAEMRKAMGQATQVADEMKKAGITGSAGSNVPKIPVKQTGLLRLIPVVQTQQQLNSYFTSLFTECKKNIPVDVATKVDQMIIALNGNENELARLPITLFLNKNIKAAVYAAVKVLQTNSNSPLVQNNSAFILQQSGYPGKAVPVFKFLQQKYNTADFNNNLAQCYLSLGDKEEAKKYFRIGLAKNPNSSEMHCGMGLILSEEGNINEATIHISESLKNGYSVIAEALAKKHKVKVKLSDIKSKAPDYFNPQKFKPAAPAGVMEDIPKVKEERFAAAERVREAYKKREAINEKINAATSEKNMNSLLQQHIGNTGNTPFARKAIYMMLLLNEERSDFLSGGLGISDYKKKSDELKKELDAGFEKVQRTEFDGADVAAKQCEAHVNNLNVYLKKSKESYENYERYALPKIYDYTNQSLYWTSFLLNGDAYQSYFYGEVHEFYGELSGFSQLQNFTANCDFIYHYCKNYKEELAKIKLEEIDEQLSCPINLKVPAGKVASFKINCRSMELEGGELLKLSFERDNKTGEFSLAFGLGLDANTGLFNAGAKGQMYFKFASDFTPIDMGLKGEAGIEAELFIFSMDEKVTGTMGVGSVNVDAVHNGKEINIFNVDATKDSRDTDASIKPLKN